MKGTAAVAWEVAAFDAIARFRHVSGDGHEVAKLTAGPAVVCPVREDHRWRIGRILDPVGHMQEIRKPLGE